MQIILEGQEQLFANMDRFKRAVVSDYARQGLKKAGMEIVADAQQRLRKNKSNTTGALSNQGRTQELADGTIQVGFMDRGTGSSYAEFVEHGREAGRMPPFKDLKRGLLPWVSKKFGIYPADGPKAKRAAYLVARKISNTGTRPHPFFMPAVEKNTQRVVDALQKAINMAINDYSK